MNPFKFIHKITKPSATKNQKTEEKVVHLIKTGRQIFVFTYSEQYLVPDLSKTVGSCKQRNIRRHNGTKYKERKCSHNSGRLIN